MHARPLVYWRTPVPYNCPTLAERGVQHIDTLEPINHMVGDGESRVTYERFAFLPDGRLMFHYRFGGSGRGQEIHNVWIPEKRRWERLREVPLFDGQGRMNAYGTSARRGPDGHFRLLYMWRNTPDARTNHTLSYAWSRDMLTWMTAAGEVIALPITVDRWKIYQTSDWDWRWEFGGGGAIPSHVGAGSIQPTDDGFLSQPFRNAHHGDGVWKLHPSEARRPSRTFHADALPPRRGKASMMNTDDGRRRIRSACRMEGIAMSQFCSSAADCYC